MTSPRCRVRQCRFPHTHTTKGHLCGICGQMGHGQIECANTQARTRLSRFDENMPVDDRCNFFGCSHREDHMCQSHRCTQCFGYGHQCSITVQCPTCRSTSVVDSRNVYTGVPCIVCLEDGPVVVFTDCGHANVCGKCASRLNG